MSAAQLAFLPAPAAGGVLPTAGEALGPGRLHSASAASAEAASQQSSATSVAAAAAFSVAAAAAVQRRRRGRVPRHAGGYDVLERSTPGMEVPDEIKDIETAGKDVATPHWSTEPMKEKKGLTLAMLDWKDLHGAACGASGVLFVAEMVRFYLGQKPTDIECYFAAVVYGIIYASRFDGIRGLPAHFRVTFYATTGWSFYYIAHLLAATNPEMCAHWVYPTGIVFVASTIYFYKHWIERMYRHFVEDRFRPYYLPGLMGLMYFHWLDCVDLFNQWVDPTYWQTVPLTLTDQAWTIQDVRLTGLFMSSMALFMITLHNKGVLTGGRNTLLTVLGTIFVPALFLTGTHATLNASFP